MQESPSDDTFFGYSTNSPCLWGSNFHYRFSQQLVSQMNPIQVHLFL